MKLTPEDRSALQGATNVLAVILQQSPDEVPDRVNQWPEDESTLTTTQEQAIRARLAAATDGPWSVDGPLNPGPGDSLVIYPKQGGTIAYVQPSWDDAELISHAPTDLAALLTELDRLRGQITEARDGWCRVCDRVCMG